MSKISNERLDEMMAGLAANPRVGTNSGHGHVWKRPDGRRMRCGGPGMCSECSADTLLLPKQPDPDTIRSILTELKSRRASPSGVEVKEDDTDLQWRDLALQFDEHRIEAMSMLRYAIRHIEEYATVRDILREPLGEIKAFLRKRPLSGSAVLAQRLKDTSPSPNGVTVTDEMVERFIKAEDDFHRGKEWSYRSQAVRAALLAALEGGSQT